MFRYLSIALLASIVFALLSFNQTLTHDYRFTKPEVISNLLSFKL